jgi:multisubunit Na+/H+ antiporter MnhE subunit
MSSRLKSRVARTGAIALATWAVLFVVWLLLVDTPSTPELWVGAGASAFATVGSELVRAQRIAQVRIRLRWLARAWRPIARVPLDVAAVMWVLARRLSGRRTRRGAFRALRFRAPGDDPEDTARRALAEAFGSLAPNTIVVGVDPGRRMIIVHQLRPDGDPEATIDPLGLR